MIDLTKPWPFGLTRRSLPYLVLGLVLFLALLQPLDHMLSLWGQGLPADARAVFRWITRWGQSDWILIPSALALTAASLLSLVTTDRVRAALRELCALSAFIFLGVGLPGLFTTLAKRLIGRGRPETWLADAPLAFRPNWAAYDYQSFPSGHTTTAFALATVLALVWPRAFWPAFAGAALIALSRIVEGAHYATDVTAGIVVGVLGAFAVRNIFGARGWLFDPAPGGRTVRRRFAAITRRAGD